MVDENHGAHSVGNDERRILAGLRRVSLAQSVLPVVAFGGIVVKDQGRKPKFGEIVRSLLRAFNRSIRFARCEIQAKGG